VRLTAATAGLPDRRCPDRATEWWPSNRQGSRAGLAETRSARRQPARIAPPVLRPTTTQRRPSRREPSRSRCHGSLRANVLSSLFSCPHVNPPAKQGVNRKNLGRHRSGRWLPEARWLLWITSAISGVHACVGDEKGAAGEDCARWNWLMAIPALDRRDTWWCPPDR
jgi:hypothetical protein